MRWNESASHTCPLSRHESAPSHWAEGGTHKYPLLVKGNIVEHTDICSMLHNRKWNTGRNWNTQTSASCDIHSMSYRRKWDTQTSTPCHRGETGTHSHSLHVTGEKVGHTCVHPLYVTGEKVGHTDIHSMSQGRKWDTQTSTPCHRG